MSQKNLQAHSRLKHGVNNKPRWESRHPITKDNRTTDQRREDQRAKAIQTCCAKIRAQNPNLTNKEVLDKATKWLDRKERETVEAEQRKKDTALKYDALHMGPKTKEQIDAEIESEKRRLSVKTGDA